MSEMLKIAVLGVAAALCAVFIKKSSKEFAMLLTLAAGTLILLFMMSAAAPIKDFLTELSGVADISPALLSPVIKTVGIAIVTKISSEICKDAGEGAIASYIEMAGAAAAIYIALPLMSAVLKMVGSIM